MTAPLTGDVVVPRLRGRFGQPYLWVERCRSTQRLLDPLAPEGAVAVTDEQSEGRGRLGRQWHAEPGTSILCSVALRPPVDQESLPELTPLAGQACAEAIAAVTGLAPAIKFPNDVLIGGRKVAGILAEAHEGRVALGVGINVNADLDQLPAGADTPPTSLSIEAGRELDRVELLVTLLERLEQRYDVWVATSRP